VSGKAQMQAPGETATAAPADSSMPPRPLSGTGVLTVPLTVIVLAAAVAFPFVFQDPYLIGVALAGLLYLVVTESWNLVLGVSGILSFAQMGFFGVGAYTSAILNLNLHISPWLSSPLGALTAVLASVMVGLPALRLRGVYVVLLTLAFQEIMSALIQTDTSGFTGGAIGLLNLDPYLPYSMGMMGQLMGTYFLALALVVIVLFLIYRIIRSPIGLGLKAMRDAEEVAANRGVNPARYKLLVFIISAFFTGLAGAFYVHYTGVVAPSVLDFGLTMNLLAMIVVGGWGTFAGPIIGTALLTVLSELLQGISVYRLVILGLIMVVTIVVAPQGLVGLANSAVRRLERLFTRRRPGSRTQGEGRSA
jgi:branched-chain amino acid transport system permease protein